MTNKLALIVAVVLGVLSILGIKAYVDKIERDFRVSENKISVMVAARDLKVDQIFTEDDIATEEFPRSVLESALRNTWVRDRQTIVTTRVKAPIKMGQVLLTTHFATDSGTVDERPKFAATQRAVTIPITFTGGLAGMLKPQDDVDLVVSMAITTGGGRQVQATRTLFKGVQVLATDGNTNAFSTGASNYQTLTLSLSPRDCNKLLFVISQGATIQCLLTQPGAPDSKGFNAITGNDIYKDVAADIGR